jgi:hypothetical protein
LPTMGEGARWRSVDVPHRCPATATAAALPLSMLPPLRCHHFTALPPLRCHCLRCRLCAALHCTAVAALRWHRRCPTTAPPLPPPLSMLPPPRCRHCAALPPLRCHCLRYHCHCLCCNCRRCCRNCADTACAAACFRRRCPTAAPPLPRCCHRRCTAAVNASATPLTPPRCRHCAALPPLCCHCLRCRCCAAAVAAAAALPQLH